MALPAGAAAGAVLQRVPPDVQGRVPQLPAGPRVAGHRQPAAPGRQQTSASRVRRRRGAGADLPDGDRHRRRCTSRCWPACCRTSACKDAREARVPRRARRQVRDLPRSALFKKPPRWVMAAELVETSRLWAPGRRADRAGVGRAAGPAPGQAQLQRAALGEEAGRGDGLREGHAVRRPARRPAQGQLRPDRPGAVAGSCSSGTPWSRATGSTHHQFFARQPQAARARSRSWSTGPAAATSWSTTRRSSTSTTSGSPPTSSPAAHFDSWWKKTRREQPDLLTFDPRRCSSTTAGGGGRPRTTTRTRGGRAALTLPLTYQFEPGADADGVTVAHPAAAAQPGRRRRASTGRCPGCARSWSPR